MDSTLRKLLFCMCTGAGAWWDIVRPSGHLYICLCAQVPICDVCLVHVFYNPLVRFFKYVADMSTPTRQHVIHLSTPTRQHVIHMSTPTRQHVIHMSTPTRKHVIHMSTPNETTCHTHVNPNETTCKKYCLIVSVIVGSQRSHVHKHCMILQIFNIHFNLVEAMCKVKFSDDLYVFQGQCKTYFTHTHPIETAF